MTKFIFSKYLRSSLCILLVTGVLLFLGPIYANDQKKEDIKKLLVVSGIQDQLGYMRTKLLDSFGRIVSGNYPKVPDAFWDEFENLVGQKEMDQLIEDVVVVYEKHMTHEVVKNLIAMFENPTWEEWKTKIPIISREAGIAGNYWTQKISKSDSFNDNLKSLIEKHELGKLNPPPDKKP